MVLSAAVHDVGHFGRTNDFLITTNHELAIVYNDNAIMENHHLANTFKIIKDSEGNIFENLDFETRRTMRSKTIEMVLATDMSQHNEHCDDLSRHVGEENYPLDKMLPTVIHAADIGGPTLRWEISSKMAGQIIEEFHQEGDELKSLGYNDLIPLFDRNSDSTLATSQIAFINYAVEPLFKLLKYWFPEAAYPLEILAANKQKWIEIEEEVSEKSEESRKLTLSDDLSQTEI